MKSSNKTKRLKILASVIADYIYDYNEDMTDDELMMIMGIVKFTDKLLEETHEPTKENLH